jgi:hypothetical protein
VNQLRGWAKHFSREDRRQPMLSHWRMLFCLGQRATRRGNEWTTWVLE